MNLFRKTLERIIEGGLLLSSAVTTIAVVLIIFFLFKEGADVFENEPIDRNFALVVHHTNPVTKLDADQVRRIFDGEITNWKTLGGQDLPVVALYEEDIAARFGDSLEHYTPEMIHAKTAAILDSTPGMIAYLNKELIGAGFKERTVTVASFRLKDALVGKRWLPTAQPAPQFGMLPLVLGTLLTSLVAILIALPLGLATAIYMAEIARPVTRSYLKPLIELLAGIPSVVYGFFGIVVVVPLIKDLFDLDLGESALAGSIILAIMALPTIITVSEDALRNTPKEMKEASLALGATGWQTIWRVMLPYAASGVTAGAILGIGRAIGETMAVLMVTGNAATMPHSLLQPVRTIPATIAAELGEAAQGGLHYKALFTLACILFVITLSVNMAVEFISARRRRHHTL